MRYSKKRGFTLIELIVVITILGILGTIGFISFQGLSSYSRDSVRISDISTIMQLIEISQVEKSIIPTVTNGSSVTYSGATIWTQGSFGIDSIRDARRMSEIPLDPLTKNEYAYSVTQETGEYQLAAIMEDKVISGNTPGIISQAYATEEKRRLGDTYVRGNYNGAYILHREEQNGEKYILILGVPSILTSNISGGELAQIISDKSFIYAGQKTIPTSYQDFVLDENTPWIFSPQLTQSGFDKNTLALVYQGTPEELGTSSGKIDLVRNLKFYYESSNISVQDGILLSLSEVDIDNRDDTLKLAENIIYSPTSRFVNAGVSIKTRVFSPVPSPITRGTIEGGEKWAWSDTQGFINFVPENNSIEVTDISLLGYIWGQNIGWINLQPDNSGLTNTVMNDEILGCIGRIRGSAWSEKFGFLEFKNTYIDSQGLFQGSEIIASLGTVVYSGDNFALRTDWRPICN